MTSKQPLVQTVALRLDARLYHKVKCEQTPDETFSATIRRLLHERLTLPPSGTPHD